MTRLLPWLVVGLLGASCGGRDDGAGAPDPNADTDMDGLNDADEVARGTDPRDSDSDDDGLLDGDEVSRGTDPRSADTDGDGLRDGDELVLGTDPLAPDAGCVDVVGEAKLAKRPVDVILVIDNSSSMGEEIAGVVQNISESFADVLAAAQIDYRIILLSYHGGAGDAAPPADRPICIRAPLSGTTCDPVPPAPANTERFFHYHVAIDSRDSFEKILATYNTPDPNGAAPGGWSDWLRPDARRVFLEISDDDALGSWEDFEAALFALEPARFGSADAPNYVFHSIVGVPEKNPATAPYTPDEAVQPTKCSTAARAGVEYQELSIKTGGLRLPVCQTDSYDAIFQAIANGVVDDTPVQCSFAAPAPPPNRELDFSRVVVLYRPGGAGEAQTFTRVNDAAACGTEPAFFVSDTTIVMCPDTCQVVQADPTAKIDVHVACHYVLD